MSDQEQNKPFVVNDRRKFRLDGDHVEHVEHPKPTADEATANGATSQQIEDAAQTEPEVAEAPAAHKATIPFPARNDASEAAEPSTPETPAEAATAEASDEEEPQLPTPPTEEEIEQVRNAYNATAERLDMMVRSQNLGGEHLPPMDFTQLVQSIYMSAMIQLGAGTQQGQQPRVDILGAKQSIDMLAVIEEKTTGNLTEQDKRLLESALFELRMGFLEITQLLARQSQARPQTPPAPGAPPTGNGGGFSGGGFTGGGPRIVR